MSANAAHADFRFGISIGSNNNGSFYNPNYGRSFYPGYGHHHHHPVPDCRPGYTAQYFPRPVYTPPVYGIPVVPTPSYYTPGYTLYPYWRR
jgi:hypothetical protein